MKSLIALSRKLMLGQRIIITFSLFMSFAWFNVVQGQQQLQWNALIDMEFSVAGEKSHFYYNEIHQDYQSARIGLSQLNLIGAYDFKKHWSVHTRLLVERKLGQQLEQFRIPQLHIQWLSEDRRMAFKLGRMISPFGSFNKKQLSTDRTFIGLPLAYSYYLNISDRIGYLPGMGDVAKIPVDEEVQWGSSILYYGGYTTGVQWSWAIEPATINWNVALVNGAPSVNSLSWNPFLYGVISRLQLQPKYFWTQGISLAHGTFFQSSDFSEGREKLNQYTQTLIGTDFKLGYGFFEWSGELIAAFYKVPVFDDMQNVLTAPKVNLSLWTGYLDMKYELQFLPGSYVAYRIDRLGFSERASNNNQDWDNDVLRHSLALGYDFNKYLLLRIYASTQQVDQKTWNKTQRTFRAMLTLHY